MKVLERKEGRREEKPRKWFTAVCDKQAIGGTEETSAGHGEL